MCGEPLGSWASVLGGSAVFVGVASRAEFDLIPLAAIDHRTREPARAVLTKSVEQAGVVIVLQHWLQSPSS